MSKTINQINILFLADGMFKDLPGGSRVVALELARGLIKRGHRVSFLVPRLKPDTPDEESFEGIRIVYYEGAGEGWRFVRSGRDACARLLADESFDIVHTHFAYAALGPLKAIPRDVPRVRSFYGPWDQEGWTEDSSRLAGLSGLRRWRQWFINVVKRVLRHRVEAVNLRQSRGIIVLSEQSLGEVSAFRCPSSHVHLLSGGVNLLRFHPVVSKDAVRHSLGLPQDRRLLLSVRRLTPRMGLDKLIAAMPTVAARRPDVLLLIGGKGSERDRLERLIVKCGMEDHVRLIGFIPDEQLASYYGAADVFILPTAALEGFGLVTVEALACGVPVLGTPIGATPEILAPLDPRLVMPGATPDALASGILAFLEEEWPQELSVDRLRQYVERNYSWDRHIEAVEAVYRTVLQGSRLGEGKTDMRNKTEGGVTPL